MTNIEVYRTELESMDDEELFGESELATLAETQRNLLLEEYEEKLDSMDMGELYGQDEWERLRAAKVEQRVEARLEAQDDLCE